MYEDAGEVAAVPCASEGFDLWAKAYKISGANQLHGLG